MPGSSAYSPTWSLLAAPSSRASACHSTRWPASHARLRASLPTTLGQRVAGFDDQRLALFDARHRRVGEAGVALPRPEGRAAPMRAARRARRVSRCRGCGVGRAGAGCVDCVSRHLHGHGGPAAKPGCARARRCAQRAHGRMRRATRARRAGPRAGYRAPRCRAGQRRRFRPRPTPCATSARAGLRQQPRTARAGHAATVDARRDQRSPCRTNRFADVAHTTSPSVLAHQAFVDRRGRAIRRGRAPVRGDCNA